MKESYSLPQSTFVVEMRHKYSVGDKVLCINKSRYERGQHGVITELMPYTFRYPAYRVDFYGKIVAMSEASLVEVGILSRLRILCRRVARQGGFMDANG
jgi:hypothetical protein